MRKPTDRRLCQSVTSDKPHYFFGTCVISASTLRYAMQCSAKDRRGEPAVKTGPVVRTTASPRISKSKETRLSRADHAENQGGRDKARAATQPGTMVIQDAFSFEIAPDTENL